MPDAGAMAPATLDLGTWRRLSPLGAWWDPVLDAVADHVSRPETREILHRHDRERSYPADVLAELHERGLASLFTDEDHSTAYHLCGLNAATARAGGSLAISAGISGLALLPVYLAGTAEQRERVFSRMREGASAALLLSEWDHGSDLARIETRAEPVDGGFRLRGEKHLINGGREAGILVTLARTGEANEAPSPFAATTGLSLFLVERERTEVESVAPRRTLPVPAADISGVRFDGTRVGRDAVVGEVGEGFSLVQRALLLSRGGIASLASGTATAAWDLAWRYARRRRVYGAPLVELEAIRDHLVRVAALDALSSALAVKAAAAVNALGQESGYLTASAKLACSDLAEEAVDEGRRALGARAFVEDLPYARLVRDVPLYGVFDGTRHVMLGHLTEYLRAMARTRRTRPDGEEDPLARTRALYTRAPRSLMALDARARRAWVPPPDDRLHALDELVGVADLAPLAAVAEIARELAGALGPGGAWVRDQNAAHALGTAVARLEAVVALAELGDPHRRDALGLPDPAEPLPLGDDLVRYAVAAEGAACAGRLRRLVDGRGRAHDGASPEPAAGAPLDRGRRAHLASAEGALLAQADAARLALHARLLDAGTDPMNQPHD